MLLLLPILAELQEKSAQFWKYSVAGSCDLPVGILPGRKKLGEKEFLYQHFGRDKRLLIQPRGVAKARLPLAESWPSFALGVL